MPISTRTDPTDAAQVPVARHWSHRNPRWRWEIHAETGPMDNAESTINLEPLLAWIAQTVKEHPSGAEPMIFETGGAGWSTKLRWDIVPPWEVQDQLRRRLREIGILLDIPGAAAFASPRAGRSSS